MEPTVPGGQHEIVPGKDEGSGQMQRIQAAQVAFHRDRVRVFDQLLIDLDDPKRRPLLSDRRRWGGAGRQSDGTGRIHKADAADEPALGARHRVSNQVAAWLSDVALDQRARVEI
jgi:hypothetical protein